MDMLDSCLRLIRRFSFLTRQITAIIKLENKKRKNNTEASFIPPPIKGIENKGIRPNVPEEMMANNIPFRLFKFFIFFLLF